MSRAILLGMVIAGLAATPAAASGGVEGRVEIGLAGVALDSVAPLVVHLEPIGSGAPAPPAETAVVHQHDARFSPSFLVVATGQTVAMTNDDAIYHNVFSYSRPNDFDLGLYPAGESRTLRFTHPGVVKLYCSIHETMNATLLVVPTRWFAVVGSSGRYAIPGVPPGRYRAALWSERLPPREQVVEIGASGGRTRLDWSIGAAAEAQSR